MDVLKKLPWSGILINADLSVHKLKPANSLKDFFALTQLSPDVINNKVELLEENVETLVLEKVIDVNQIPFV